MAISSIDILNLSHSLKDICEVNCDTPACLSQTLKLLMQYNLIQANLQFCRQLGQEDCHSDCPPAPIRPISNPTAPVPPASSPDTCPKDCISSIPAPYGPDSGQAAPSAIPQRPPVRLDIGDPFLADHET